ncbi:hypothetical protein ACQP2X_39335 [Actinoplanes sp. CA-131856]
MADSLETRLLLRAAQACRQQADTLQQTLARVHGALPPPDAPSGQDERELNSMVRSQARRQVWSDCVLAALSMGVHVADHVRSLGLLLTHVPDQGAPLYAHASLVRGAVESAAWLRWLLAEGQPFTTRFGRGVAFLLEDAALAVKAAEPIPRAAYLPLPAVGEKVKLTALLERLQNARIETIANGPGTRIMAVRVARDGDQTLTRVKVSQLVIEAFGDLPGLYESLSGVAHARSWQLADNLAVSGRQAAWQADAIAVSVSVLAGLIAAERAGELFAAYRGSPEDPGVQEMSERRANFDREMLRYGRTAGHLARLRPIDGFLSAGARSHDG